MTSWIRSKEQHANQVDVGEDLEQVELMQKKFDDFQADLKENEIRLQVCKKDYKIFKLVKFIWKGFVKSF